MTPARAAELVGRFGGVPLLVVGDVMLDRFIVGRVTRISPEAPVPIVRFESDGSERKLMVDYAPLKLKRR